MTAGAKSAIDLKPLGDRVVVQRTRRRDQQNDMEVKAGDTVIHSKYAGTEVEVQDEELLVLGSNDILAVTSATR